MIATLQGPAYVPEPGTPATYAALVRSRVLEMPDSVYVEYDVHGTRTVRPIMDMAADALHILDRIEAVRDLDEGEIVLCAESAQDFIPALWAGACSGRNILPWHLQRSGRRRQAIREKLTLIGGHLTDPILLAPEPVVEQILALGDHPFHRIVGFDRATMPLLARHEVCARLAELDLGAQTGLVYLPTSGTSAIPKIVVMPTTTITHNSLIHDTIGQRRSRLYFFPLDSVTGLKVSIPRARANVYLQPERFAASPIDALVAASEQRLQTVGCSTSLAGRMADALQTHAGELDFSALEYLGFGGEMADAEVISALFDALEARGARGVKIGVGFGMTETSAICSTGLVDRAALFAPDALLDGAVSLGDCMPSWSLRVISAEGRIAACGEIGEIEVHSGQAMFAGYLCDSGIDRSEFTDDGWFRTGDLGRVDDGVLRVTGRKKATLIVNGRNISLERIESEIRKIPGLRPAMVVAAAVRAPGDPTDALAVFFVPDSGGKTALDALRNRIRNHVTGAIGVVPRHVVALDEEDLPRGRTGKISRYQLSRRLGCDKPREEGAGDPHSCSDKAGAVRIAGTVGRRGEAERARHPVDVSPAERARHGWRALALQAEQECVAPQAAVERTGTYSQRVPAARTGPGASGMPSTDHECGDPRVAEVEPALSPLERIWAHALGLEGRPERCASFFDLGGDSLASASLIFNLESEFGVELPIEAFFSDPTFAKLESLIGQARLNKSHAAADNTASPGSVSRHILPRLQAYLSGWKGDRLFPDSLVVGANTAGSRDPLFWVCQGQAEFLALARALGPEQPVYGFRSCVGLLDRGQHTAHAIDVVTNRYLWELLAVCPSGRFSLGGNCQAGIFAYAMAKRLARIGRRPHRLILLEWTYSFGRYDGSTVLLYGTKSSTARIYDGGESTVTDWRSDFPNHQVRGLPAGHGRYFLPGEIGSLAGALQDLALRSKDRRD